MIEITDLKKSYGQVQALRGVSFAIAPGQIVGLLGPNGAGKTTIMKVITGYLQPDGGTVVVDGLDVLSHTREVQARIGYLPENAPLYPELLKTAPHNAPVKRLDEVKAAKDMVLCYAPGCG